MDDEDGAAFLPLVAGVLNGRLVWLSAGVAGSDVVGAGVPAAFLARVFAAPLGDVCNNRIGDDKQALDSQRKWQYVTNHINRRQVRWRQIQGH